MQACASHTRIKSGNWGSGLSLERLKAIYFLRTPNTSLDGL